MKALNAEQIRRLDREAIEKLGIPSLVLMEKAGRAVALHTLKLLGKKRKGRVCVLCGCGNNGGDGFVASRHLDDAGVAVTVNVIGRVRDLKPDAAVNLSFLQWLKMPVRWETGLTADLRRDLAEADVIVDALFGVGLNRPLALPLRRLIQYINELKRPVIAVDIPSGLDATSGKIHGACIRAAVTVTMSAPKLGFLKGEGPRHSGRVVVANIGIPPADIPQGLTMATGTIDIGKVVRILRHEVRDLAEPSVTLVGKKWKDPFLVLISCILSLRTKDATTLPASERLFALADNPQDMLRLSVSAIEKAVYPVGFYRTKARNILGICRDIIEKFGGRVPDDLDTLMTMKGVGRKTANLVLTEGFGKLGVCVDTHVHRISNRFGYVRTKTPEKTEWALRKKLPQRYWIEYNALLVTWGQNVCHPVSPKCSLCRLSALCPKTGVTHRR